MYSKWLDHKQQIDIGANPHVDFKMSNLKPIICGWLRQVWMEVKTMKPMLIKG